MQIQVGDKELTMRSLTLGDVFTVSRIIKKMGLTIPTIPKAPVIPADATAEEKAALQADIEHQQKELGLALTLRVVESAGSAEGEVTAFLADLVGMGAKELAALPLEESMQVVMAFAQQPGLSGFFGLVGKSL